jgi:Cu/Ag efflux protein CusF
MKKLAFLAVALLASAAIAQDKKAPPAPSAPPAPAAAQSKGVAGGEVTTVTSTVEAIDQKTRVVTLKGQDGKMVTFVAGPEVKNLAQVQKGDIVTMAYIEAVAAKLVKTENKTRSRVVTPFEKRAEAGQKPAGVVGVDVKVVASVEAVDAKAGKVTLRGPEHTATLKVDPALLKNVKVGDMVEAEFVEALAVKVEKAPAAPAKPAAPAAPAAPAKK